MTKTCPRCNRLLGTIEFNKDKKRKSGISCWCKSCVRENNRVWYEKNKEREILKRRKWREENRNYFREFDRRRNGSTERIEKSRKYYEGNSDAVVARTQKYKNENPDKYKAHKAVGAAIQRLDLPPAWGLVCEYCQEAQAQCYHHDKGYEPENHLDVVALCHECHGKEHRIAT